MNIIKPISDLMIEAIKFFYSFYPNYGVAIILLTVVVKIALYPLSLQSTQQMSAVQKIQPKLKELQKKHKENPKELQEKTAELYKNEGVNPLGGCLPMLLQIPFFIALFFAVQGMKFSGPGAEFLWITDLSKPDPTYILVILIALSTYWSQKTMPQASEMQTSAMNIVMPAFIAFVSAPFPSGVQVYWLAQTVISAAQQAYILKKIKSAAEGRPSGAQAVKKEEQDK
jgi:YidC/Oxa1 family membrane protein insertase